MESVEKIAAVVLYEGYLLYPYRRSAMKNQQRWTFGGVYPRQYSEAGHGDDPWCMQTQCLVVGDENTTLTVTVRFLHVVARSVLEKSEGVLGQHPVEALRVGAQVYRPWDEAIEREIAVGGAPLRLGYLLQHGRCHAIEVPTGHADEALSAPTGGVVGALRRAWQPLQGTVEVAAEPVGTGMEDEGSVYRLTVRIANTLPWTPPDHEAGARLRDAVLRQTFISTHTILRVQGGAFVSLLEPPAPYQEMSAACQNSKTWPVLVGEQGERHTLLSSPIILYDYPRVSPESPGDLFDGTEIDELLRLSIMTLTEEEKQEMSESDPRAREILEQTEALTPDQLAKLHGAVRGLQAVRSR